MRRFPSDYARSIGVKKDRRSAAESNDRRARRRRLAPALKKQRPICDLLLSFDAGTCPSSAEFYRPDTAINYPLQRTSDQIVSGRTYMRTLLSALFALLSTILPLANVLAQTDQEPPTAVIVSENFSGGLSYPWQPVSGNWSVANRTYASIAAGGTNISVITEYRDLHPAAPPMQ